MGQATEQFEKALKLDPSDLTANYNLALMYEYAQKRQLVIEELQKQGRMIVVSGPSGVGKTTLVETMLEHSSSIVRSVSATTRLPRSGETDGVDYHFLPKSEFEGLIEQNGLGACHTGEKSCFFNEITLNQKDKKEKKTTPYSNVCSELFNTIND